MAIIIGSKNPTKVKAVQEVFNNQIVYAEDVPSNVSNQPLSDEETLMGASNRAKQAIDLNNAEIGIGLEGGVMELDGMTYLCSWGAMIDKKGVQFNASGARIPLPIEITEGLRQGKELGDLMDLYAQKQDVRKNEGAIGIFTNNLIGRKEMFVHILKLMKGQHEIYYKNKV
ncbi:NTPase [Paraliobacillus quinghaiensis]|uniref:inosine/xanthosine triphosphatase n=1 Tax=Paraliobacillus quinghaiensis TaxID=470815 RepID=A0A917WT12_9BACI|nr:DUF84 family protein [Paraliobacillus quinghaiensis]GGM26333.1 NTPase [Paraliobacillus quinghaiensis]